MDKQSNSTSMPTISIGTLALILGIADQAIAVVVAEKERREANAVLDAAYSAWKQRHSIGRIERDTLDWTRMTVATKAQYEDLVIKKDIERNARKRLGTAVKRYQVTISSTFDLADALKRKA